MWKADAQHRSPIPVPNDSNQQNNNSEKQHNQPLVFGLIFFGVVMLCGWGSIHSESFGNGI